MNNFILVTVLISCQAVFVLNARYTDSIRHLFDPLTVKGETGEHFEGDMVLTDGQKIGLFSPSVGRNGLIDVSKRWPNNTFVYFITENEFSDNERTLIMNAISDIANNSCIVFRERVNDEYAVRISNASEGCFSNVGYINNEENPNNDQVLNLGEGCFRHGTIVHEMLHALGFLHMQSTYDRDDYVRINWSNIQIGKYGNFAKYNNDTVTDFGVAYDYGSVMHYSSRAFSWNGLRTIVPLQDGVTIGQRVGMSERDILKLNRMYCNQTDIADSK